MSSSAMNTCSYLIGKQEAVGTDRGFGSHFSGYKLSPTNPTEEGHETAEDRQTEITAKKGDIRRDEVEIHYLISSPTHLT